MTYARRYALCAMLGIVNEDDDAEEAKIANENYNAIKELLECATQRVHEESGTVSSLCKKQKVRLAQGFADFLGLPDFITWYGSET